MRASVLRRKWGRWFHIRPIYLFLLFLRLFLRLLNHLLCQLLNQLLSLLRFLPLPGHCILPCCSANDFKISSSITKRQRGTKLCSSPALLRADFNLRLTIQPSIDVLAHLISGETVALLDYTLKLFALSVDHLKIVIGELAPLLFDLALSLFPISFDAVPVHFTPPS